MLSIAFIKENLAAVKQACINKNCPVDVDSLLKKDEERRQVLTQVEAIKAEKNAASKQIPQLEGEAKQKLIADMKAHGDKEKALMADLQSLQTECTNLILKVPQPCSPDTPVGKDDTDNVEMYTWGELPQFDFEPKDHVEIGKQLDILDIPRAAKVAGSRNYFLKGDGALLEHAVLQYTAHKLANKGFTLFNPPQIVNYAAMQGTSYFPGGEEQAYAVGVDKDQTDQIESDHKYLIGTSEVSVASYHMDEMLKEDELPKLYAGLSSCYRREAGTYGKDTHGLYRVHQFQKVEQVILCKNDLEESKKMHALLLKNAEEVLQDLKLPYRVVAVCTGDIGQGQYYKNDIETWMPSRDSYGETHSCSTFLEFQSRRLNIRYKNSDGKTQFVHTLNNTAIATPRVLISILETYQNADGSVTVPEVLVPYMGGRTVITAAE